MKASLSLKDNNGKVLVAMKNLKVGIAETDRRKLLLEACLMAQFQHRNILEVVGVVISVAGVSLLTSFCELGALLNLLRERRTHNPLSLKSRYLICRDIARGMVCCVCGM